GKMAVATEFHVPLSGDPDLVVEQIDLTPDNGLTRVAVTVRNRGYAPAFASHAVLQYTDASEPDSQQPVPNQLEEAYLGPFSPRTRVFDWDPVTPDDTVTYTTDSQNEIKEPDETNNTLTRVLNEVDTAAPEVLSFTLDDPKLDGTPPGDGVWGRYIHGVG